MTNFIFFNTIKMRDTNWGWKTLRAQDIQINDNIEVKDFQSFNWNLRDCIVRLLAEKKIWDLDEHSRKKIDLLPSKREELEEEISETLDWKNLSIVNCYFEGKSSDGFEFRNVEDSYFWDCTFKSDIFKNAEVKKVAFKDCNFIGVDFEWVKFDDVEFNNCIFPWTPLVWVDLSRTKFIFGNKQDSEIKLKADS